MLRGTMPRSAVARVFRESRSIDAKAQFQQIFANDAVELRRSFSKPRVAITVAPATDLSVGASAPENLLHIE